mmetsp:Transcript_3385/g.14227  ORF Transcript_3385/g.14227 Transcript_3385/m.14227 type:complete len:280 (-) Transcript_3385:690-1529(-)
MRVSIIGPRSSETHTRSLPLLNNAASTPLESTPLTTPDLNIALVNAGRSSRASIRSRSNTRSIMRFSMSTFSVSAHSSANIEPTPDSTSFTATFPPSARMRRGNPDASSAATTPASSSASPVPPTRPSSASCAEPERSSRSPTSAAARGASDSKIAADAFANPTISGVTRRSIRAIASFGTNARAAANGSRATVSGLAVLAVLADPPDARRSVSFTKSLVSLGPFSSTRATHPAIADAGMRESSAAISNDDSVRVSGTHRSDFDMPSYRLCASMSRVRS